ncbi:hypothetical protein ILUMI_02796 [Ignelater luminosus]|uniref:C2H2-type domain-containing protein n=1 Tax=Ignelater luminosus TaxID=2038154 RepID=A0A8K0DBY9_IGNLU|nr:hypothetical protein ILUMI_02796 [Ignelater luminosus]
MDTEQEGDCEEKCTELPLKVPRMLAFLGRDRRTTWNKHNIPNKKKLGLENAILLRRYLATSTKRFSITEFWQVLHFSISESLQQQNFDGPTYDCPDCGRAYKLKSSLRNHRKWECGKEPQFKCPCCAYKAKQKMHLVRHLDRVHKEIDYGVLSEMELTLEVNEDKE